MHYSNYICLFMLQDHLFILILATNIWFYWSLPIILIIANFLIFNLFQWHLKF
jgi:hypothetical protein